MLFTVHIWHWIFINKTLYFDKYCVVFFQIKNLSEPHQNVDVMEELVSDFSTTKILNTEEVGFLSCLNTLNFGFWWLKLSFVCLLNSFSYSPGVSLGFLKSNSNCPVQWQTFLLNIYAVQNFVCQVIHTVLLKFNFAKSS